MRELKGSHPVLRQYNLKSYSVSMKDHLAICFQRIIKKGSCENIKKQPCKTFHNTSTRHIIKEVYSFYSDQRKSTEYP